MGTRFTLRVWLGPLAAVFLSASAGASDPQVRIGDPLAARIVREAIVGASQRLAREKCQQLLRDFSDASGRPLLASLDERQSTPEAYLGRIIFYDGSGHELCGMEGVLAFTVPGNYVVFVCAAELRAQARLGNRLLIEATLIHEMLHSLGLGENPPSTLEITSRVLSHCR